MRRQAVHQAGAPGASCTLEFERVYRRNVGFVFRVLKRFGVAPTEIEDAAQEVFIVVHRKLADFDPTRGTVKTWIFAVTRGVAANRRRTAQRRLRLLPPAPTNDGHSDPERRAGQRQVLALVDRFLATLPAPQREVFELVDIEGMRGPEVSELLGIKVNTIYTRARAARLAFKAYVAQVGPEVKEAHG